MSVIWQTADVEKEGYRGYSDPANEHQDTASA